VPTTTVNPPIQTQFNTGSDVIWTIDGTYTAHVDLGGSKTSYILRFQTDFTPVPGAVLTINSAVYTLTLRNDGSGATEISVYTSNVADTTITGGTQAVISASAEYFVVGSDTVTLRVEVQITGDTFYFTSTSTVGIVSVLVNYTTANLFNGQMLINF